VSGPLVLGFETSCDETGVAVLEGFSTRSSVLASQVDDHARFGGVVPEVAARAHVEAIRPLTHQAITQAGIHPDDIDAVAVTRGPGLIGPLMVGYSFAKSFAYALGKPLYGIDHMEGHLFAPRLSFGDYEPPAVVILASGGHSQIVHVKAWGDYEVLGGTIDDAAGEAFDKLARFMGLGFPGGPAIDSDSDGGDATQMNFLLDPTCLPRSKRPLSMCSLTRPSTLLKRPALTLLEAAEAYLPTDVFVNASPKRPTGGE